MTLKFYTSLAKGLKLKVKHFWQLSPTFVEVTRKTGRGSFCPYPPPSWTGLNILEHYLQYYLKKWSNGVDFWCWEFRWVGHQSGAGWNLTFHGKGDNVQEGLVIRGEGLILLCTLKDVVAFICNLCWHNSTIFFDIFIFRCIDSKLRIIIIIILLTNWLKIVFLTVHATKI